MGLLNSRAEQVEKRVSDLAERLEMQTKKLDIVEKDELTHKEEILSAMMSQLRQSEHREAQLKEVWSCMVKELKEEVGAQIR